MDFQLKLSGAQVTPASLLQLLRRVAVQVDVNDSAVMNLALNNVSNVAQHYSPKQS